MHACQLVLRRLAAGGANLNVVMLCHANPNGKQPPCTVQLWFAINLLRRCKNAASATAWHASFVECITLCSAGIKHSVTHYSATHYQANNLKLRLQHRLVCSNGNALQLMQQTCKAAHTEDFNSMTAEST
jgi:hypothetical protein